MSQKSKKTIIEEIIRGKMDVLTIQIIDLNTSKPSNEQMKIVRMIRRMKEVLIEAINEEF